MEKTAGRTSRPAVLLLWALHLCFIRHNCGVLLHAIDRGAAAPHCRGESLRSSPMSLDADLIVDRRRMRRKLTFWRVIAVLIAIVAIVGLAAGISKRGGAMAAGGDYIARIKITGLIRNDQERVESLEK